MNLNDLNTQLTIAFKKYITQSNHNATGRLYNSIQFRCTDNKGKLKINFDSMDYVLYLDNGDFVNNFFELSSTLDIIGDYVVSSLDKIIQD